MRKEWKNALVLGGTASIVFGALAAYFLLKDPTNLGFPLGLLAGESFIAALWVTSDWRRTSTFSGLPKELLGPMKCGQCGTLLADIPQMAFHAATTGHGHFTTYGNKEIKP